MNEPNQNLPTTKELTTLAATLARTSNDNADSLAKAALKLWRAANATLEREAQADARRADVEAEHATLPTPKRYPVTRDAFGKLMLPAWQSERTAEVAEALKGYCAMCIERDTGQPATDEAVASRYAGWRDIDNPSSFAMAARQFLSWWNYHHPAEVSAKRRKSALSRTRRKAAAKAKHKARPPLARLQAALKDSGT